VVYTLRGLKPIFINGICIGGRRVAEPLDEHRAVGPNVGRVSMLKDKTFTYRGHTFQVRVTLLEKGWAVQVFEHEKPISPPYKITHDTAINYSTAGWGMPLKLLCIPLRTMWRKNIFQR
jgi:hypothetical protein